MVTTLYARLAAAPRRGSDLFLSQPEDGRTVHPDPVMHVASAEREACAGDSVCDRIRDLRTVYVVPLLRLALDLSRSRGQPADEAVARDRSYDQLPRSCAVRSMLRKAVVSAWMNSVANAPSSLGQWRRQSDLGPCDYRHDLRYLHLVYCA